MPGPRSPLRQVEKEALDVVADCLWRRPPGGGDGLDGPAGRHLGEELLVARRQAVDAHRAGEGIHDHRVESGAPHGYGPHGVGQLVALRHPVLE